MDRNYNIPPPKLVDAIPGRLVWAKLGQWPNWPSRVVTLDDVPSNLRSGKYIIIYILYILKYIYFKL